MSQWSKHLTTEQIAASVAQVAAGLAFGIAMLLQLAGVQLAPFAATDVGIIVAIVAAVLFVVGGVIYMWQARSYSATIKRIKDELRKSSDLQIARIENAYVLRLDWMKNDQDALRAQVTLLLDLALRNGSISPAQAVAFKQKPDPEHRLYDNMLSLFSLDDLKVLAFEIGLPWDMLAGDRISVRLIDMINEAKHAGKLAQLEQRAREMRPNMNV